MLDGVQNQPSIFSWLIEWKETVSLRKDIIFQRAFPSTKASHFPFSTQTGSRSRRACQLDSAPIFYLGNRSKAVILKAALVRGSNTAEHDSTHLMALVAVKWWTSGTRGTISGSKKAGEKTGGYPWFCDGGVRFFTQKVQILYTIA